MTMETAHDEPKLPEHLQPSMAEIQAKFFGHLDPELLKLFVLDVQTDCACKVEVYDTSCTLLVLYPGARVEVVDAANSNFRMPIHEERITNEDLRALIDAACKAGSQYAHLRDICHRMTTPLKSEAGFDYYAPEPMFFGTLTANVRGWGAMCFEGSVLKERCTPDVSLANR
jgi:hypothetical protein